jgi:hypothetical protein
MGFIENMTQYYVERAMELQSAVQAARQKIQLGTYKMDDYFADNLRLWMDAADAFWGLFPSAGVDPAPMLFALVNPAGTPYNGAVAIAPLRSGASLQVTEIIALAGSGGLSAGDVTIAPQADNTLNVTLANLNKLSSGGVYAGIVYDALPGGRQKVVAQILLHAT